LDGSRDAKYDGESKRKQQYLLYIYIYIYIYIYDNNWKDSWDQNMIGEDKVIVD